MSAPSNLVPLGALLAALALSACSGGETSFRDLTAEISLTPERLDDWTPQPLSLAPAPGQDAMDVIVGEYGTQTLFVTNAGRADLNVSVTLEGDDAFVLDHAGASIDTDDTESFVVTFTPENFLEYTGRLVITSNDEDTPEVIVPLRGSGIDAPRPDIELNTQTIDFGTVDLGNEAIDFDTLIENVGTSPLRLGAMTVEGSPAFRLDPAPLPGHSMGAGDTLPLVIRYEPLQEETGDNGVLVIPSNDPDEPEVMVNLIGNGGGDFEYPEAIIDPCPSVVEIVGPQTVRLGGGTSYDPAEMYPLEYTWLTLLTPGGSASDTHIVRSELAAVDVDVDVAGEYTFGLQVHNALDTPSTITACTMSVVPADDIRVELSWQGATPDLDLHLLEDEDAEMWDPQGDMHYCNRNSPPDWGESGSDDDPRLDIDDQGGYGPENINVGSPVDSSYPVKVHYYNRGGQGGTESATVVVWAGGVKVYEETKAMEYNDVWDVGSLVWPDATFEPSSEPLYPSPRRSCVGN